jgi:heme exporter protein D
MNAQSISDFVAMGGYALYVWGSLAMCAVALLWDLATLMQRRRRALEDLRDDARAAAAAAAGAWQ